MDIFIFLWKINNIATYFIESITISLPFVFVPPQKRGTFLTEINGKEK